MFTTTVRGGKAFEAEQNKRVQEQNSKTERPKDEGAAHNYNFAVFREYEQC